MSALQIRNSEMVDLLRPDFQARNEPNFALVQALGTFRSIPGLRAFWPMASVDENGQVVYDFSNQGHSLFCNGAPTFGFDDLAPYVDLESGTPDYLERPANFFDFYITGVETTFGTPGLTFGAWVNLESVGADRPIISAWTTTGNQRAYTLDYNHSGTQWRFSYSDDGTIENTVDSTEAVSTATWTFVVARFIASTEASIFVDNNEVVDAATQATWVDISTEPLRVGQRDGADMDGKISFAFVAAQALSDAQLFNLYTRSRALYGV